MTPGIAVGAASGRSDPLLAAAAPKVLDSGVPVVTGVGGNVAGVTAGFGVCAGRVLGRLVLGLVVAGVVAC